MRQLRETDRNSLAITIAFVFCLSLALNAAVPPLLSYQGRLQDSGGNPLDGTYGMTFTIYDAPTGGSILWSESQIDVAVSGGLFATQLGKVNPLPASVFETEDVYLGITVGADPEMSPRQRIVTSAYSDRVQTVDGAEGGRIDGNLRLTYPAAPTGPPLTALHLETEDIGLTSGALEQDRVVVEAADAVLGLYSNNTGVTGSGLAFGEIDGGKFSDKWGIIRETSGSGSALVLTYGSKASISANSAALWINSNREVGVGTTAPDATLNIQGGRWNLDSGEGDFKVGNDTYRFKIGVATGGGGAGITRMRSQGGANALVLGADSSDVLTVRSNGVAVNSLDPTNPLTVYGFGTSSGAFSGEANVVTRFRNSAPGEYTVVSLDAPSDQASRLVFSSNNVGKAGLTYYNFIDRFLIGFDGWYEIRIDESNHNVGIGRNPDASYQLAVAGDMRATDICYSGTIGACSDRRFKKNITPLTGSLDKVMSLRPVNYEWRREEFPDRGFGEGNKIGLIAQEVEDIVPEVVKKQGDGYYSVDYGRLTPILIGAVQEQQATIKELKSQLAQALKRLDDVESKLRQ